MKTYSLTARQYHLLKELDFSELGPGIFFSDIDQSVSIEDFSLFLTVFTEEIVGRGLDEKQEECTDYGRELYAIYDELVYRHQREKEDAQHD